MLVDLPYLYRLAQSDALLPALPPLFTVFSLPLALIASKVAIHSMISSIPNISITGGKTS